MKRITLTVEPNGEFSIDMDGFHGKGCKELMDQLTKEDQQLERTQKREFHESVKQTEKARS